MKSANNSFLRRHSPFKLTVLRTYTHTVPSNKFCNGTTVKARDIAVVWKLLCFVLLRFVAGSAESQGIFVWILPYSQHSESAAGVRKGVAWGKEANGSHRLVPWQGILFFHPDGLVDRFLSVVCPYLPLKRPCDALFLCRHRSLCELYCVPSPSVFVCLALPSIPMVIVWPSPLLLWPYRWLVRWQNRSIK